MWFCCEVGIELKTKSSSKSQMLLNLSSNMLRQFVFSRKRIGESTDAVAIIFVDFFWPKIAIPCKRTDAVAIPIKYVYRSLPCLSLAPVALPMPILPQICSFIASAVSLPPRPAVLSQQQIADGKYCAKLIVSFDDISPAPRSLIGSTIKCLFWAIYLSSIPCFISHLVVKYVKSKKRNGEEMLYEHFITGSVM